MRPTSAQTVPADPVGTQVVSLIDAQQSAAECEAQRTPDVGAFLRTLERELTDAELERHIKDAGEHLQRAYRRFQDYGNAADRDEALQWWEIERRALQLRSQRIGAARHASFERQIGSAWFASDEAQAMGRGAA